MGLDTKYRTLETSWTRQALQVVTCVSIIVHHFLGLMRVKMLVLRASRLILFVRHIETRHRIIQEKFASSSEVTGKCSNRAWPIGRTATVLAPYLAAIRASFTTPFVFLYYYFFEREKVVDYTLTHQRIDIPVNDT